MPHVFISYVRDDTPEVERLCHALRDAGVQIWIDRDDIPPGVRWKRAIRKAISEGDLFVACFSPRYFARHTTYMNEELTIAIDILRQKPFDRAWFIPVLLSECEIPDREIGGGETLSDLQHIRLYEDWDRGIRRLVSAAQPPASREAARMTSILVLYADPDDPIRLRVDEEIRDIQQTLITSPDRDRFLIEMKAVRRASDLLWALSSNPQIVYFSGHSTASGDLVSETGTSEIRMSGEALAKLFEAARPQVQCVVFNFAHSQALARAVAEHVPNVIAMRAEMSDTAAVEFTRGFFGALAAGRPIRESFDIGCATLRLRGLTSQNPENPSERNEPMLFTGMADPSR